MERKSLDQLLGNVETYLKQREKYKTEFYKDLIELHQDERLRNIASKGKGFYASGSKGFYVIKGKTKKDKELLYTEKGFEANIPKYCTDYDDGGGYYVHEYYSFQVEWGKLLIRCDRNFNYSKAKELLELFPEVTTNDIIKALEKGIKDLEVYKNASIISNRP